MAQAESEIQYLVLADGENPYFLARVRWPDVAQAISEDCPGWLDDPGLFDLPYEPASEAVNRNRAAKIAAEWGAQLPPDSSTTGVAEPRLRRIPPTWSDMVPEEKRSWSLEHVAVVHAPVATTDPQPLEEAVEEAVESTNGDGRPTEE